MKDQTRPRCDRCGRPEKPIDLCECLSLYHRKARVINLHQRNDLWISGWEEYPYASQVTNYDSKGRVVEHLVPYKTAEEATAAAILLNADDLFFPTIEGSPVDGR